MNKEENKIAYIAKWVLQILFGSLETTEKKRERERERLRESSKNVCVSVIHILATVNFRGEMFGWIKGAVSFEYLKDFFFFMIEHLNYSLQKAMPYWEILWWAEAVIKEKNFFFFFLLKCHHPKYVVEGNKHKPIKNWENAWKVLFQGRGNSLPCLLILLCC